MLEVSSLASSSSGNCFYIGSARGDILIDAGISAKQIVERLTAIGKNIANINAIFVTHEHTDHVKGIEMVSRKYNIPIFVNKGTLCNSVLDMGNFHLIQTDEDFEFNGLKILPFSVSHDAAEPVNYLIRNGQKSVSVITDVGYCCDNVGHGISQADAVFLEANHDSLLLRNGKYPNHLKKRIASSRGHLSNYEAAISILEHARPRLRHVVLSHLSHNNNHPIIAMKTMQAMLGERSDLKKLETSLSFKDKPSQLLRVD
ncbi:MBL fold metallo-hydrolase [Candidatus Woesearchaeota archaeon]|nr:MBL fold metallo-hydrolase [Candidatus Woesearchaeota archaeon]